MDVLTRLRAEWHAASLRLEAKPLLIGGMAMEYYGIRKAGADIDLVVADADYQRLAAQSPASRKDLWGDLGVVLGKFEIWRSIALLDYDFYCKDAVNEGFVLVVSLDRLLFMRVIAMEVEKYRADLQLMKQFYYDSFRNKSFTQEAEARADAYQRHNGAIFGGQYDS